MNKNWNEIITDYEREDLDAYILRMNVMFPNVPHEVLCFLHNSINIVELQNIIENVNFHNIIVETQEISNTEFLSMDSLFPGYIDDLSLNWISKIKAYAHINGIKEMWYEKGTWKTPVIIYQNPFGVKVLLEGHTRLGILKGALQSNKCPFVISLKHEAYILIDRNRST